MNPTTIVILDFISMAGTILCLNLSSKTYKAWAWYLIPTTAFMILMINAQLPFQILMGISLFITGIRNFKIGRRKACAERK